MKEKVFSDWYHQTRDITARAGFDAAWQHQQAKVEELQEEFAEDERFLKEQIQQKDLEISNLKYLQGMDKELIQTLQGRSSALQDKVNELQKRVDELSKRSETLMELIKSVPPVEKSESLRWAQALVKASKSILNEEQALKGEV